MGRINLLLATIFILGSCATNRDNVLSSKIMNTDTFLKEEFANSCNKNSIAELKNKLSKTVTIEERASIWMPLGSCLMKVKSFLEAKYYYDLYLASGLATKRNHSKILTNTAMMMEYKGQNYMGLELYDQALIKDPSNPAALFLKSILLIEFGEYEDASKNLKKLNSKYAASQVVQSLLVVSEYLRDPKSNNSTSEARTLSPADRQIFNLAKKLKLEGPKEESISELKKLESEIGYVNRFKETLLATIGE